MANILESVAEALVYTFLLKKDAKMAKAFQKKTKALALPDGSPSITDILKYLETTPPQNDLSSNNDQPQPATLKRKLEDQSGQPANGDEEESEPRQNGNTGGGQGGFSIRDSEFSGRGRFGQRGGGFRGGSRGLESGRYGGSDSGEGDGKIRCIDCQRHGHTCNMHVKRVRCSSEIQEGMDYMPRECPEEKKEVKCYNCQQFGHMSQECPEEKKEVKCYNCQQFGHMSRDCPERNLENWHVSRDYPEERKDNSFSKGASGSRGRGRGVKRGGGFKGRGGGDSDGRGRGGQFGVCGRGAPIAPLQSHQNQRLVFEY